MVDVVQVRTHSEVCRKNVIYRHSSRLIEIQKKTRFQKLIYYIIHFRGHSLDLDVDDRVASYYTLADIDGLIF